MSKALILGILLLVGQQLSRPNLSNRGATIIGISLCRVFGPWLMVAVALFLIGVDPVIVLLLAGMAPPRRPQPFMTSFTIVLIAVVASRILLETIGPIFARQAIRAAGPR